MTANRWGGWAAVVGAALLAGCTTVKVTKVEPGSPETEGVVYALPKPLLKITPMANGTMQAEFLFVPDPDNTFAIVAKSYVAKHELTTDLGSNGVLTKLIWNPDATEAVKEALDKSAAIAAGVIKARSDADEAEKKARKDDEASCKAAEAEVRKAEADVRDKQRDKEKKDEVLNRAERLLTEYQATNSTRNATLEDAAFKAKQDSDDASHALNESKIRLDDATRQKVLKCEGTGQKNGLETSPTGNTPTGSVESTQSNPSPTRLPAPPAGDKTDPGRGPVPLPGIETKPAASPKPAPVNNNPPVFPQIYAPMLFSLKEVMVVRDEAELQRGSGQLDVRLVPISAGTSSDAGPQDRFPATKPAVKINPPGTNRWTISGDAIFTGALRQESVIRAGEEVDELTRRVAADPANRDLKIKLETAGVRYTNLLNAALSLPLRVSLTAAKPVSDEPSNWKLYGKDAQDKELEIAKPFRLTRRKTDTEWEIFVRPDLNQGRYQLRFNYPSPSGETLPAHVDLLVR